MSVIKMKVAFLISGIDISGGMNVVFQHAIYLASNGVKVSFIANRKLSIESYNWHKIFSCYKELGIDWLEYQSIGDVNFDIAVATYWATYFELWKVNANSYVYFVQSIESRFVSDYELPRKLYIEATYDLPIGIITEAKWIKHYLETMHNLPVYLVPNGIDKDYLKPEGDTISLREPGKLRVLVEGPLEASFKNVPRTIELCRLSEADEIWLLTSSTCNKYDGVTRVFSQVPIKDIAPIYRSCDVIIKLSYVEGMFGPPLEMFHCGGTCIVYDVTGHDEYIKHGFNGLVAKTGDEPGVINYINQLKHSPKFLEVLKQNALTTAHEWINWQESSRMFQEELAKAAKSSKISREHLEVFSRRCNSFIRLYDDMMQGVVTNNYMATSTYAIPNIHWAHRVTKIKLKLAQYPLLYKIIAKLMNILKRILKQIA